MFDHGRGRDHLLSRDLLGENGLDHGEGHGGGDADGGDDGGDGDTVHVDGDGAGDVVR